MLEANPHLTSGAPHDIPPQSKRHIRLRPRTVFRAGALIQDETFAASATITTVLTASAARRASML